MGSLRWAHAWGLRHKILVMKENGQELFNIMQLKSVFQRIPRIEAGKGFHSSKNKNAPYKKKDCD